MAVPEFLICVECETPCYNFEWEDDEVVEAVCETCGCEELEQFVTEEQFDGLRS